jgi:hypothetical protein
LRAFKPREAAGDAISSTASHVFARLSFRTVSFDSQLKLEHGQASFQPMISSRARVVFLELWSHKQQSQSQCRSLLLECLHDVIEFRHSRNNQGINFIVETL